MKNLITYLKTLWGAWGNLQSSDVSLDRRSTVVRPSGLEDKLQLNTFVRFAATLVLVLTIGVGNAWGADQTYTLVSDLSTLTSSDKVLIVSSDGSSNYYALKNNQVTSAANLGETSVTISSNTITADLDADYTWYLEYKDNETIGGSSYRRYYIKSTKGTYYLQNAGATGSIINSKSATELQNVWVIGYTGSASIKVSGVTSIYYVTGLYNRGNSRMLAHVSSDWRCYASTNWNNLSNRVVQIYKKASSCANKVTLTKGSTTNGTFDLDKANGEHDNCDANFVVHVSNIVPADGSKYCNGIDATGGNSTVTGPVEGVWTVTYTKGNNITSTITPTYATKTSYTVTWYNEGASIGTESVYSGDKVSALPSPAPTSSCSGEFIGWVRSDAAVADKSVTDAYTTDPSASIFTNQACSPPITGNTEFHAVYRMRKPD